MLRLGAVYGSRIKGNYEGLTSINFGNHPGEMVPWNFTEQAGWAQINGRDDIPIPVKVEFDEYYLKNMSFFFDFKILLMTFIKVVKREGVTH